ncbi:MAG: DUF4405 domain-containing protein [Lachnospiraceae bacterium]|nr:DUF4405 domain-containing protein [Lachnospiraceae bacterium]
MNVKQIIKIITDIAMTFVLLLLMSYSLVGEAMHEWLGIVLFALFILHHILNSKWSKSLFKGKYTPYRILQTVLVGLALCSMLGSMVSSIILSRYALSFLPITGGQSWARTLHMLSAYWGFIFISLHLGLHWNIMLGMVKRMFKNQTSLQTWTVRLVGLLITGYGIYAFIKRDIGSYMFLEIQFVFFDFDEPLVLFLLDYIAVMGLFVFIGHYFAEALKRIKIN